MNLDLGLNSCYLVTCDLGPISDFFFLICKRVILGMLWFGCGLSFKGAWAGSMVLSVVVFGGPGAS